MSGPAKIADSGGEAILRNLAIQEYISFIIANAAFYGNHSDGIKR